MPPFFSGNHREGGHLYEVQEGEGGGRGGRRGGVKVGKKRGGNILMD